MDISERFKKIIFSKLNGDLSDCVFLPTGRETWIVDLENKFWYFQSDCFGLVYYNSTFFNNFFKVFTLKQWEYQPILKEWFEKLTEQKTRNISRRTGDFNYMFDILVSRKNDEWSIFERYGWSFPIVKKYVDLKKSLNVKYIPISELY